MNIGTEGLLLVSGGLLGVSCHHGVEVFPSRAAKLGSGTYHQSAISTMFLRSLWQFQIWSGGFLLGCLVAEFGHHHCPLQCLILHGDCRR